MNTPFQSDTKNIVGRRVKIARKRIRKPITQQDLSARLGVLGVNIDRVSISKIESGNRYVADYEVLALANALEVSVQWLLTGEGSPIPR